MTRPATDSARLHVILPKATKESLERHAKKTGMTTSEHVRRALDLYLSNAAEKLARKP